MDDERKTIEIQGRTRYASGPTTRVTVREDRFSSEPLLVIHGGLIEQRDRSTEFVLGSKHMSATDEEHDSAYVTYLEGAGLALDHIGAHGITFTAVILKAKYYAEEPVPEDVGDCDYAQCMEDEEKHGYLPFTPPKQTWKPGVYEIYVEYIGRPEKDEES
jgi:hypothetical protein